VKGEQDMSETSPLAKNGTRVYYWPSGARADIGGKGVGHIAVLFGDGTYISHVPYKDMTPEEKDRLVVGRRDRIPGSTMRNVVIHRLPSVRFRKLADDEQFFGNKYLTLDLPARFLQFGMKQQARGLLLVTAPDEPVLSGPLPYYQLADREEGAGDRSQCATTTAKVVASGLSLSVQDQIKQIEAEFMPDSLWDTLKRLAAM